MNVKRMLEGVCSYFVANRHVGHTTAAVNGVKSDSRARLVCTTKGHAVVMHGDLSVNTCTPEDLRSFVGIPIVFDNYTVHRLCHVAVEEITRLEEALMAAEITRLEEALMAARCLLDAPLFQNPVTAKEADQLLHQLWTQAVDAEGYDKSKWLRLQKYIEEGRNEDSSR